MNMKVIICLDDHDGLLFNNRRQSLDREIHRDMVKYTASSILWMNEYTHKSFAALSVKCCVDNHFWELAKEDEFCFVEDGTIEPNLHRISEIVIYRWNRVYPSDVKFSTNALANWHLVGSFSFPGHSHELITREVYRR